MAREPKTTEPRITQADPTAPRPSDDNGRALDAWGLPLSGPARAAALAETGKPDPRDEPDAWAAPDAPADPAPDTKQD